MKQLLFVVMLTCIVTTLPAQVVFYESFDGIAGPTAGGAGTYTFPAGWRLRNVDNRTPAGSVSYVNEAWERREDFGHSVVDSCAFSTSWYSPAGAADDWMWTPLIGALPANSFLSWNAIAYDGTYPDGYEVRIMTAAAGPPTGGTGVLGNQVSSSTQIFTIASELSSWTTHTVNLSAYAGQSVYIAFRNTSNDKFLLAIDDVKVEVILNYDAQVSAANTYEYTKTPKSQVNMPLGGTVKNTGSQTITNVGLAATVLNSSNATVFGSSAFSIPSLASGASNAFTLGNFITSTAGTYTIKYYPFMSQSDQQTNNDTLTQSVVITDSVFARDDGIAVGQLGIGAGDGYLGQSFTITTASELRSVTASFAHGYTGKRYAVAIWNTTAGTPNAIVASTDTLLYPDDNALTDTIPIHGGYVNLTPGKYVATVIEFDSTVQLVQTNNVFTTGTTWVKWSGHPAWANIETFGSGFTKSFYLRMNVTINNNTPVITSNGGGAAAGVSIAENASAVTTVTATDADAASPVYYVLNGGADAAKFSINTASGALSFITPPDFDLPGDADANNTYIVVVRATDGVKNDDQTVTVTVGNVNDNTPVITSNGGGGTANISVLNPQQSVTTVTATDADGSLNILSYSITGGADAGDFTINTSTGQLSFINPTNVNSPQDADLNNIYLVTVQVSDGTLTDNQALTVTVTGTFPVTLLRFGAWAGSNYNMLEWSTANEAGMESYEIERSTDGHDFIKLAEVAAKTNTANEYRFADIHYQPVNFYRLKMKGRDGSAKYSEVVRLARGGGIASIKTYPNPVHNGTFALQLSNMPKDDYRIELYDAGGRLVMRRRLDHPGGSATIEIKPASSPGKGLYLLVLKGEGATFTQNIIIE
jgi:hypothetical protein